MTCADHAIVTGAFSYTGGYIARNLLQKGIGVTTLTRHPDLLNSFGGAVKSAPLDFSDTKALTDSMIGASVFYNTYWIRFERGQTTWCRRQFENPLQCGKECWHQTHRPHLRLKSLTRLAFALFQRQMASRRSTEKYRHPVCNNPTNSRLRPRRPPA